MRVTREVMEIIDLTNETPTIPLRRKNNLKNNADDTVRRWQPPESPVSRDCFNAMRLFFEGLDSTDDDYELYLQGRLVY